MSPRLAVLGLTLQAFGFLDATVGLDSDPLLLLLDLPDLGSHPFLRDGRIVGSGRS